MLSGAGEEMLGRSGVVAPTIPIFLPPLVVTIFAGATLPLAAKAANSGVALKFRLADR